MESELRGERKYGMKYLGMPVKLRRPHAWQDQMAEIGLSARQQNVS